MISTVDNINVLEEGDLNKLGSILFDSLSINKIDKKISVVSYKEAMINGVADLLKKMLIQDREISGELKLNIIDLLDKLHTQKEHLEIIKSNILQTDIEQASKRLSKKSQSAFELK